MAELIVPKIIDELGDVLVKQFGEKINLVMGVEKEVANISSKLATIEKVLHDAERRRLKDRSVGIWLEKLEDITYEMDDVLDEWNFKIHRAKNEGSHQNARLQTTLWIKVRSLIPSLCSCLKQVPVRSDIALKIKSINEKLELTLKEADQFKFITSGGIPDSQDFQRIITTSMIDESKICGRESDKVALLDQVLSKSSSQGRKGVQVISVVGAGGSGKTTLAQLLFNNDKVRNHFELRNWICVSDPFDQKRIAKAILENAGKSSQESELDPLIQRIKETFSGKRFLLVLDDVWTEDDSKWEPFQNSLKDGAPGSDSICQQIRGLVQEGGKNWAEKCKGLPLAAKTMGSLLRFKDTVQQWQNVLDSEIWQLEEATVELFPHLYLSYNELSPELKRCFSYCAVFPKDHEILVNELIRLWIAQGYVRPRRRGERLELVGREYFNNLAMRSFFQELEKVEAYFGLPEYMKCKMHDIVHDFAQFLTKNECALDGIGTNSSGERAHHLTILEEGTEEEMFSSRVVDFGRLRSFITFARIGRVVPQNLFCILKCVRTLTLSNCGLAEIPAEIGRLIHLRRLDLSDNLFITLPEAICDLYYLETLDINCCEKLSCLPERIEGLVHLRHLFNKMTVDLRQIPQGLTKLTSLCTLARFIVRSNYDDLAILKDLNQLERLAIVIEGEVDFGSAKLGKKINMREMFLLFSERTHFIETPSCIETMQPPPNLELLVLVGYPGTQLPSWLVTKSHANNLTKLSIARPHNISSLLALRKLSFLEELVLGEADELKCLGKEFFGVTKALHENSRDALDTLSDSESSFSAEAVAFPNLRKLYFREFDNWTNWEDVSEDDEEVAVSIMPCLEELKISQCYKLEALPHRILSKISSLKNLDIQRCDKLRDRYFDKIGDDWIKISHIPRLLSFVSQIMLMAQSEATAEGIDVSTSTSTFYLGSSVYASRYSYDRCENILRAFFKYWCLSTNTLHTPVGELSIIFWDLYRLGGLSIDGSFFDEVVPSAQELLIRDKEGKPLLPESCRYLFSAYYHLWTNDQGVWMKDWIRFWFKGEARYRDSPSRANRRKTTSKPKMTYNPSRRVEPYDLADTKDFNVPFDTLDILGFLRKETYIAAFIACWICKFLLPSKKIDRIRPSVFKVACLMATGKRFCLAIPVLASIYHGLREIVHAPNLGECGITFPIHYVYT
ncbi:putative disease resistance protein RGA3 [Coffea eugenioides]|uniref:putative disease resistance protein RGA3 n=1 Tax=Coffea eugenioides TaxID=49369 RepID=UPI000F6061D0|nr:putative disease resistance protein RGA3 [Coffea eugenioides]